jgi:hypothetical protein
MTLAVGAARLTRRDRSLRGTGIVEKTGGYVGLAGKAGPAESEPTLTHNGAELPLVRQQGVVRGASRAAAQHRDVLSGSHSVWPVFVFVDRTRSTTTQFNCHTVFNCHNVFNCHIAAAPRRSLPAM